MITLAIGWALFYFLVREAYTPRRISLTQHAFLAGYALLLALCFNLDATRLLRRKLPGSWLDSPSKRFGSYFVGALVLEGIIFLLPLSPFYRNVFSHTAYFLLMPLVLAGNGGRLQRWLEPSRAPATMPTDSISTEIVLSPSRRKAFFVILAGIGFVAIGWFLRAQTPVLAWTCIVFFGLGIPAGLLMLVPGFNTLTLRSENFTIRYFRRQSSFRWEEIADLTVVQGVHGERVAWNTTRPEFRWSAYLRETYGRDMVLTNSYGLSADALRQLMQARQASAQAREN